MLKRQIILVSFFLLLIVALWMRSNKTYTEKVYRIGRDPSWYPLSLMGKEKNILAFSDDLLMLIAEKKSFKALLLSLDPTNLESSMIKGSCDAVMSSLEITASRKDAFKFSNTYFFVGPVLVLPYNSPIETWKEMKEKTIGIPTGHLIYFPSDMYPSVVIKTFDSTASSLDSLLKGEIDAIILNTLPAYSYINGLYKGVLKIIGPPITDEGLKLISTKNVSDLIETFNLGLQELKDDGSYNMLLNKWGLFNPN